jgi:phosphohistidine phosphatase SixA/predicted NUDIX family NTP pyrophosphohydrolase
VVSGIVRAAGGVVSRTSEDGRRELLLVHRPAYDDWTFPKGKLRPGERDEEAALREVREETGLRCRLEHDLGHVSYRDRRGRPKLVRYWTMQPLDGAFVPTGEIDEVKWLTPDDAGRTLSYPHDQDLVALLDAATGSARTVNLHVVRHAQAEDRERWAGPDDDRPLTREGIRQAEGLVGVLEGRPIERVLSSPAVRCRQTVEPLARARGLPLEIDGRLLEGTPREQLMALLADVATRSTALCTHGDVIEEILANLVEDGILEGRALKLKKGSTWVIQTERRTPVRASYIPPPG